MKLLTKLAVSLIASAAIHAAPFTSVRVIRMDYWRPGARIPQAGVSWHRKRRRLHLDVEHVLNHATFTGLIIGTGVRAKCGSQR